MNDEPTQVTEGSWTVYGLPDSHYHCQLSNFRWDWVTPAAPMLQDLVARFIRETRDGSAPRMILSGLPGRGKTHLAVAIYRQLVRVAGTRLTLYLNVPRFCDTVKRSYQDGAPDPFVDLEDAKTLVILDDLFGREWSPHEKEAILPRIIDTVYQTQAALLLTMHYPIETVLDRKLAYHTVSRIMANHVAIEINGEDRR